MAQKTIVDCDLCGEVLEGFELQKMSEVGIIFREVGMVTHRDKTVEVIKGAESYSLQFCKKCAPGFLEKMKQLIVRK